jgi:hypothetical protein
MRKEEEEIEIENERMNKTKEMKKFIIFEKFFNRKSLSCCLCMSHLTDT